MNIKYNKNVIYFYYIFIILLYIIQNIFLVYFYYILYYSLQNYICGHIYQDFYHNNTLLYWIL